VPPQAPQPVPKKPAHRVGKNQKQVGEREEGEEKEGVQELILKEFRSYRSSGVAE